MRITLIHALKHSILPIEASFARLWPEATLMNLVDDSLSADLARDGRLTDAMTDRFLSLGRYAASTGADAILFTCSAFGPCIEAVAREQAPMPVLKPNEAMIEQAAARGHRIGLLSTFPPTLASMPREFPSSVEIVPKLAAGALAALDRGDRAEHDRLVAEASRDLRDCDLIALAQYSMAPAAALVAEASGRPVLTTPDSAVAKLKQLLARLDHERAMHAKRCNSEQTSLPVIGRDRRRLARRGLLRGLRLLGLALLRRDRQDQLRVVIGDAVDPGRDLMPGELALARRRQQRHHLFGIVVAAIEPALEIVRRDRHRHAVMQHREIGARRRGDDRHRVEFLAVRADPGFRQARKPDRAPSRRWMK